MTAEFERARKRALRYLEEAAVELRVALTSEDGASARQIMQAGEALVLLEQAKSAVDKSSRRLIDEEALVAP